MDPSSLEQVEVFMLELLHLKVQFVETEMCQVHVILVTVTIYCVTFKLG